MKTVVAVEGGPSGEVRTRRVSVGRGGKQPGA